MHRQAIRALLFLLGFAFLALAVVGTLLPIMPTIPFLLLAIWCFARSSERMHQWILNLPTVGVELRAWEKEGAISNRAKIWATVVMIGLVAIPICFRPLALWVKLVAFLVTLLVLAFILSRPKPKSQ
ncbi:MAG: YbaN family protein [Planctomycetota bacterium]|nr:YbaN family protein [Planctomycetota bacterium]MDA1113774.1 YbaN family protein [Planctomycetota bacterium]